MRKTVIGVLALSAAVTAVLWRFAENNEICYSLWVTGITTLYHIGMRLLVGGAFRLWTPKNPEHKCFQERPWEKVFYRKIRIKHWKRLVPTYREEEFLFDRQRAAELLKSTCRSEAGHTVMLALNFVPLLFSRFFGGFWVFFITSLAAGILDLAPILVQRYNRPRLLRVLHNMQKNREIRS